MANNNQKMVELVNKQIANWTVLHTKIHNFHWNVKGHHFFTLHPKFDELNADGDSFIDELAERLRTLGEKPVGTLKEALEQATVNEAKGNEGPEEMVQAIVDDFTQLTEELKVCRDAAKEAGDDATEDMLLGIEEKLDTHIWMLSSYLG